MKNRKITDLLCVGMILGFTLGLIHSSIYILANRYIQYKLYRIAFEILIKNLNFYITGTCFLFLTFWLLTNALVLASKGIFKDTFKFINSYKYIILALIIALLLGLNFGLILKHRSFIAVFIQR